MIEKILFADSELCAEEVKKLFIKAICVPKTVITKEEITEKNDSAVICLSNSFDYASVAKNLNALGYKTVLLAYTDELITEKIDNSDLEKHGYKFEDGV